MHAPFAPTAFTAPQAEAHNKDFNPGFMPGFFISSDTLWVGWVDFAPDCETFRGTNPRDSKTLSNGFAPNCLGMDFLSTAIKCRKIYPAPTHNCV
jgi:hypothetical protein